MANSPEELALELSRAALQSQDASENQLREKATTILSAASIVVPLAAVALGSAPSRAAIPFGVAALAYFWCARCCGLALFPRNRQTGLLGGELLKLASHSGADLRQMQASAADYLDISFAQPADTRDGGEQSTARDHLPRRRDPRPGRSAGHYPDRIEMPDKPSPKPGPPSPMPSTPPPSVIAIEIRSGK